MSGQLPASGQLPKGDRVSITVNGFGCLHVQYVFRTPTGYEDGFIIADRETSLRLARLVIAAGAALALEGEPKP